MGNRPWEQHYDPGMNLSPVYSTLPLKEQFIAQVKKHPNQTYIYFADQEITYQEANTAACKLANALINVGVQKGDRVALTLPNTPEFVIAVQACLKIGAVAVPTNPHYTKRELAYQYINSGAGTIICLDKYAEVNIDILKNCHESIKRIIDISKTPSNIHNSNRVINYDEFVNNSPDHEPDIDVSAEDLALLIYTGGTTGVSKGCCITNANLIAVASGWKQMCQYFTDVDHYKVLSTTPMYHIHGFQTAISANILLGGSMIIMCEVTIDNLIAAINKHEPNVWPAVPGLIKGMTKHQDLAASKTYKIQLIGCGSAPLTVEDLAEFESIVGVPILEGYGASETSMAVTSNPLQKRKVGSVGIPYPNTDFKVADLEKGEIELPLGEIGELCFKGPQVIKEYWQNPEDTALTFKEGWWYSGDIGYMDEDGFIFIIDRKKDIIICNGFNVFSNEVDQVLNSHHKIQEAGVIGIPDAKRGETVKAYVVLKPGEKLSEQDIIDYCRQYLTGYKIPTEVEFIDILPRTSVKKLDRKALRLRESTRKKSKQQDNIGRKYL